MTAANVTRIKTRMAAIYTELAALTGPSANLPGAKPNTSGGGGATIDHQGYKRGLYEELKMLEHALRIEEGAWEEDERLDLL